jgi:hypothetical protein
MHDYECKNTEGNQVFSSRQYLVQNKHFLDKRNQGLMQ